MMPKPVDLSIIIPAYNSARFIGATVHDVVDHYATGGVVIEVLVCDDGSTDGTAAAVPKLPVVTVLRSARNRGKGAAIRHGMLAASGSVRAFTDADLPYGADPIDLARLYIEGRGFHAVIGDRTLPGSTYRYQGVARSAVSTAASLVFRTLVTGGIYDTQCGLKAFRGDVAAAVFGMSRVRGFAFDVEIIYLLLKHRLDIKRLPVQLVTSETSTVHVVRDSFAAARDIVAMRANHALGRYSSAALRRLLEEDLRSDGMMATRQTFEGRPGMISHPR